ncbi:hypothetical protein PM8797T_03950 [Gimesia maris DSM 8797]|nr:hypothetical protein PM8797T_03950 [Gimesia maris DSM 8797]
MFENQFLFPFEYECQHENGSPHANNSDSIYLSDF